MYIDADAPESNKLSQNVHQMGHFQQSDAITNHTKACTNAVHQSSVKY